MTTSDRPSPRESPKRSRVTEELRSQIVRGDFPPGTRLSKRSELREHYGISHVTIQRALDELIRDGFVYTRGRGGTFVSMTPPHLYQYGLLVDSRGSLYVDALKHEAQCLADERGITWRWYEKGDRLQLEEDAREHRLAGVILASRASWNTPLHVPSLQVDPELAPCGRSTLVMDFNALAKRGMEHLSRLKIKHVTAITSADDPTGPMVSMLKSAAAEHGLSMPEFRMQYLCPNASGWADRLIELLMNCSAPDEPEALFVTHDQLLPAVLESVARLPIANRRNLTVITHANFRSDGDSIPDIKGLPHVIRLGFDMKLALRTALAHLEAQRVDKHPPRRVDLPVLFEEEVPDHDFEAFVATVF